MLEVVSVSLGADKIRGAFCAANLNADNEKGGKTSSRIGETISREIERPRGGILEKKNGAFGID